MSAGFPGCSQALALIGLGRAGFGAGGHRAGGRAGIGDDHRRPGRRRSISGGSPPIRSARDRDPIGWRSPAGRADGRSVIEPSAPTTGRPCALMVFAATEAAPRKALRSSTGSSPADHSEPAAYGGVWTACEMLDDAAVHGAGRRGRRRRRPRRPAARIARSVRTGIGHARPVERDRAKARRSHAPPVVRVVGLHRLARAIPARSCATTLGCGSWT